MRANIIILDNYDSFTYNLVDEFNRLELDLQITVYRNTVAIEKIMQQLMSSELPSLLVLSPGPGTPEQAGCLLPLIEQCQGKVPIMGICLGHQALVQAYGGQVVPAGKTVHGKASWITTEEHPIFAQLPNPLSVARYHSLIATETPKQMTVLATGDEQVMVVYEPHDRVLGFQFHPESILTYHGSQLLQQSLYFLLEDHNESVI